MKKHDVDNYYVGNLNFAFPIGNALLASVGGVKLTDEDRLKRDLFYTTIVNGAINLELIHMNNVVTSNNKYRYDSVLTLFYKEDDNYYCLHNGNTYKLDNNGDTFCSDLIKLKDIVPKFGYNLPNQISNYKAKSIFNGLFKNFKINMFNNDKFNLNDFYIGSLDLCEGSTIQRVHKDLSIPTQIIMFKQELYTQAGYSRYEKINDEIVEAHYAKFKSIYLKLDDENYYNINNFKIYNIDSFKAFDDKVSINKPLKKELGYTNLEDEVTITKVLKKQKKL